MKRRANSESSKTTYYDDVFTNIDLYKNIIKQCGEYYTQLNTIYNMCLVCKTFSLSRNDTIMLCGVLGLFEKSDKSKFFPILIKTLNCNADSIMACAYNKINFFFIHFMIRFTNHALGFAQIMILEACLPKAIMIGMMITNLIRA
jgi:hypothetical protein